MLVVQFLTDLLELVELDLDVICNMLSYLSLFRIKLFLLNYNLQKTVEEEND